MTLVQEGSLLTTEKGGGPKVLRLQQTLLLGQAAGVLAKKTSDNQPRALIAKDTRRSNYTTESILSGGLMSAGVSVQMTGPLPTYGLAWLVRSMRADLGVMICAPNETYEHSGIQLFDSSGQRISSDTQAKICALMHDPELQERLAKDEHFGNATRIDGLQGRYIEYVKNTFPDNLGLDGQVIVIDCANGAAYDMGPKILQELGAEVRLLNVNPNGLNINHAESGFRAPKLLEAEIKKWRADFGIALNSDASSVTVMDRLGVIIGDDRSGLNDGLIFALSCIAEKLPPH